MRGIVMTGPSVLALRNCVPGQWPAVPIDAAKPFKWQTRRLCNPQPAVDGWRITLEGKRPMRLPDGVVCSVFTTNDPAAMTEAMNCLPKPYRVGELLYVKETWAPIWTEYEPDTEAGQTVWDVPHRVEYRADTGARYPGGWPDDAGGDPACARWRSARYMPERASRLTLRVMEVGAPERVQSISEEDAKAEGLEYVPDGIHTACWRSPLLDYVWYRWGWAAFAALWDSLHGKDHLWASDPYVWPISLMVVEAK